MTKYIDVKDYLLDRYQDRTEYFHEVLGGKCARCGTTDKLDIDHIDPETKSFTFGNNWGAPLSVLNEELKKCQLLCRPCHIEKTRTDGSMKKNPPRGEKCGAAKLKESDVLYIREQYASGAKDGIQLAKQFNVDKTTIYNIIKRKRWSHI